MSQPGSRIVVDPNIRSGRPVVEGSRVAVDDVLDLFAQGLTVDQIISDCFPTLSREDVLACVRYAADVVRNEDVQVLGSDTP